MEKGKAKGRKMGKEKEKRKGGKDKGLSLIHI